MTLPESKSLNLYYGYEINGEPIEPEYSKVEQPSMVDLWNKLHPDRCIENSEKV